METNKHKYEHFSHNVKDQLPEKYSEGGTLGIKMSPPHLRKFFGTNFAYKHITFVVFNDKNTNVIKSFECGR